MEKFQWNPKSLQRGDLQRDDPSKGSGVGFGFGQTDDTLPGLELAALLEQFNALIALQHAAFCSDRAASFKAGMLAHGAWTMNGVNEKGN